MAQKFRTMYQPEKPPHRNLHDIVLKLELSPETILHMSGRQEVQKAIRDASEYLETFDLGDKNHPYEYILSGDTSQREKEDEKVSKKEKRKKKKKGKSEADEAEPEKKKSKKEEEPAEAGGLTAEPAEPEADYGGEDDEEKDPTDKPEEKEDSSESESVEDTSGLKLEDESEYEMRSPIRLTERPRSPDRPPSWKAGDGKGKQKGKFSKGKSKNKSKYKAKYKHYDSEPIPRIKVVEMLLEWANKHQASWDQAKRNYMTWYELRDFAVRAQIKKKPRNTRMSTPYECHGWKKYTLILQDVDGTWDCSEVCEDQDYEEEFTDESPSPHLLTTVLVPPWIIEEEMTLEASRGKGYSYYSTGTMKAHERENFYKGLDDMYSQDDLIKERFTQQQQPRRSSVHGLDR